MHSRDPQITCPLKNILSPYGNFAVSRGQVPICILTLPPAPRALSSSVAFVKSPMFAEGDSQTAVVFLEPVVFYEPVTFAGPAVVAAVIG